MVMLYENTQKRHNTILTYDAHVSANSNIDHTIHKLQQKVEKQHSCLLILHG